METTNKKSKDFESARSAMVLRAIGGIVLYLGLFSAVILFLANLTDRYNDFNPISLIYLLAGFNCVLFWAFATGIADIVDNTKRLVERFEEKE